MILTFLSSPTKLTLSLSILPDLFILINTWAENVEPHKPKVEIIPHREIIIVHLLYSLPGLQAKNEQTKSSVSLYADRSNWRPDYSTPNSYQKVSDFTAPTRSWIRDKVY